MKTKKILAIISAIVLLLAIPNIWPYAYFMILRWVVAGSAVYIAFQLNETKKTSWVWTFGIVALLFNPITPIHLTKEIWVVIDLITAVIFLSSIKK